jgi:hypothetical protein
MGSRRKVLPPPTASEDWEGDIRGPVNLALMTVLNTIYLSEDGAPVQNGAFSAVIAEVVGTKDALRA